MSQFPPPMMPGPGVRPHRGTVVLVLGILSLVVPCGGWILGIIAWVMGNNDLREMDAGRMDPSGRGMTQAGKICGIVAVCLHLAIIAIYLLWILVFVGLAAGAAAGGGTP